MTLSDICVEATEDVLGRQWLRLRVRVSNDFGHPRGETYVVLQRDDDLHALIAGLRSLANKLEKEPS